jgi:NADPH2:quinone reductase
MCCVIVNKFIVTREVSAEMRAYAIDQFGEPGSVRELPEPEVSAGSVVIRVRAASVNVFDGYVVMGGMKNYAEHRFPLIPGMDAAGVVVAAGEAAGGQIKPGDEVIATSFTKTYYGGGTFAEFVDVPASAVARKPAAMSFEEAATLPLTGLTALDALDAIDPQSGQVLVVVGATGGVGGYFTQMAAQRGANVFALARDETAEYASELGAAEVIDREAADPIDELRSAHPDGVEAIADFSGDTGLIDRLSALLKPNAKLTTTGARLDADAFAKHGTTVVSSNKVDPERLSELSNLVDSGKLRAPRIRTLPLERAAEMISEVAQRHNEGKVVLTID